MPNQQVIQDNFPWVTTTNVVIDPIAKTATATGVATVTSKPFSMTRASRCSLFVQSTGGSGGTGPSGWRVIAFNDYDSTRPVQLPGTAVDITADFGAAGASTVPGIHQFAAAFTGASQSDRFATWGFPWAFIQFRLSQTAGTGIYTAQFFCGET